MLSVTSVWCRERNQHRKVRYSQTKSNIIMCFLSHVNEIEEHLSWAKLSQSTFCEEARRDSGDFLSKKDWSKYSFSVFFIKKSLAFPPHMFVPFGVNSSCRHDNITAWRARIECWLENILIICILQSWVKHCLSYISLALCQTAWANEMLAWLSGLTGHQWYERKAGFTIQSQEIIKFISICIHDQEIWIKIWKLYDDK